MSLVIRNTRPEVNRVNAIRDVPVRLPQRDALGAVLDPEEAARTLSP